MKKNLLLILLVGVLSSCSTAMRIGNNAVFAKNEYDAKRKIASRAITNRGGEAKSTYLNYTFSLEFYGYKLLNKEDKVVLLDCDNHNKCVLVVDKKVHRPQKYGLGGNCSVVIDPTPNGTFVRVFKGQLIVKRCTM